MLNASIKLYFIILILSTCTCTFFFRHEMENQMSQFDTFFSRYKYFCLQDYQSTVLQLFWNLVSADMNIPSNFKLQPKGRFPASPGEYSTMHGAAVRCKPHSCSSAGLAERCCSGLPRRETLWEFCGSAAVLP